MLGKYPLISILALVLMIAVNYNSFSDYFTNKVVLPQVKVDNGILKDTIYTNQYLGWTIKIPSGYSIIPDSVIEHNEKKGEELIGKMSEVNKPIRLLNITNGDVGFQSTLNPRVLYPQMTNEEVYLARIDQQFQGANLGSVKINKTGQGEIRIGDMQFKYAEYLMIAKSEKRIIFFSKFNKDYMLDISIIYSDSIEGKKMFDRLKESKMSWK